MTRMRLHCSHHLVDFLNVWLGGNQGISSIKIHLESLNALRKKVLFYLFIEDRVQEALVKYDKSIL